MDIHNSVRILVTGATGFIGRNLIPALGAAGHEVVAATRHPETYDGPGEARLIDLEDPDRIAAALDGCDAAFYLIHSMAAHDDFEPRDRAAAEAFASAAKQHDVRVVYLGGLGEGDDGPGQSAHLRSRHEVGRILRHGADTVELQAAIVIGAGSTSFEILRQLVDRLPIMVCPRWVTTRCQPIALDDVVRYLVAALELPAGRYEVGGSQVLTYEQMMQTYAQMTGRKRVIIKVPVLSTSLSSHWIGLVTDQPAPVARPLAEGLSVEVVVNDHRIRQLVPFEPMDFRTAVRRALIH
jgi:uncharacterized protein YbjT (DUF2867 family)